MCGTVVSTVLGSPPTILRHPVSGAGLTGHSKLPIVVNVSVNGCQSQCVSPATD